MRDLRSCDLNDDWRTIAQDRSEWRSKIRAATQKLNITKEAQEKGLKDEQKRRHEARQSTSILALHCNMEGCGFKAINHADFVNHQRQKHEQSLTGQCQSCLQTFNRQGLHNHERFCHQRMHTPLSRIQ